MNSFGQGTTSAQSNPRQPLHMEQGNAAMNALEWNIPHLESVRTLDSVGDMSRASTSLHPFGTIEPPNFGQIQMLLGSLLFTTVLALGSAFDARNECIDQEMYSWLQNFAEDDKVDAGDDYQNYGDDFSSQEGRQECLNMFRNVIVPVSVTAFVFGPLALFIIHRHLRFIDTTSEVYVPSHLSTLLRLLMSLLVILVVWTYGIFSIMLKPKVDPGLYKQNPFKSLAAVDQLGRVGPNANLYYTCVISQTIIMVLVYQVSVECIRRLRRGFRPQSIEEVRSFSDNISVHEKIQTMLSYTSARRLASLYKERQKKWYQSMLNLRQRSGYWVAAFCSSVVIFAGSAYVFVQVLVNLASAVYYGSDNLRYRDVCSMVQGNEDIPEEFCVRTSFAVLAGAISSGLCVIAMILHLLVRRKAAADEDMQNSCTIMATQVLPGAMDPDTTRFHLGLEFLLSFCLSILLGFNAVFATGVQGPAASVGNLYYASWFSCFVCLRLCLGCLEEMYHVKSSHSEPQSPDKSEKISKEIHSRTPSLSGSELSIDMDNYRDVAKKERSSRLRKYFFLAIFSTSCFASAWDAAYNQESECSREQKYLIIAPAFVAGLSVIMFLLCLKPRSYLVVSHICFGGLMSVICFLIWLLDLIITMHSEDSWAVNGIGEMKLANLYYGSWASIIIAALQMLSYIKPLFGGQSKDAMFLVWATNVKVCMVILGAAFHVWYKIRDTCGQAGNDEGDMTFCARTIFAMVVAVIGVVSGWSVMALRILGCSISSHTRSRAETALSLMLVMMFGVAVALITSIGGPGQSVGDLFYATWISFGVSLHIFVSCYDQMKQEELEVEVENCCNDDASPYVDFSASQTVLV